MGLSVNDVLKSWEFYCILEFFFKFVDMNFHQYLFFH